MEIQLSTYSDHGEAQGPGACIQGFVLKPNVLCAFKRVVLDSQNVKKKDLSGQLRALKCPKGSMVSKMQSDL